MCSAHIFHNIVTFIAEINCKTEQHYFDGIHTAKFHSSTVTQPESRNKKLQYIFRANREHAVKLQINHFQGKTAHFQPNNLLNFIQIHATTNEKNKHSTRTIDAMRCVALEYIIVLEIAHFVHRRSTKSVRNQFRVPCFYHLDNEVTFSFTTYIELFHDWNHDQFF